MSRNKSLRHIMSDCKAREAQLAREKRQRQPGPTTRFYIAARIAGPHNYEFFTSAEIKTTLEQALKSEKMETLKNVIAKHSYLTDWHIISCRGHYSKGRMEFFNKAEVYSVLHHFAKRA